MDTHGPKARPQIVEYFNRMNAKSRKTETFLDPGELLANEILKRGLTNAKVSAATSVDEGTISRWTKGNLPKKVTTPFEKVCAFLRIKPAPLLAGEIETDESIPEEMTVSAEEKARRLLYDDVIGESFRKIVDSLFEQNCLGNRRQTLP